ncbi:DUF362 domain-containing protein [bacterium]|nr:DUF362 domain-containing protein [bacterium]
MTRVMIHPATYDSAARAVEKAFELFPLDVEGKKVLIKPNVLRSAHPLEGITTHPAVLKAVVRKVESMQPSSLVVGDNPGLVDYGANETAFRATGLMEAAQGHYMNIGNDSRKIDFNPEFMPFVSLSQAVLDADLIISLPKFKTHGLTVISGCIKNSYGFLPGAQKAKLHRAAGSPKRFQEMIVDIFRLRVPDLFIMDAVLGMEGNGPASPDLRDIGLILASDNAVSLDAVMATMMGCDPGRLGFLRRAQETGLGSYDLDEIKILGDLKPIPDFKLPPFSGEANLRNETIQALISGMIHVRPKADDKLCTRCGCCVDQCPVSALSIADNHVPSVDTESCIACFCCQEICPEKAITLG